MPNSSVLKLALAFSMGSLSLLSGATTYSVEYFQFPGAATTIPTGVNNSGKITGYYVTGSSPLERGFIKDGNTYTPIDYPGAGRTLPGGINSAGQVVGTAEFPGGTSVGFVYDGSYSPFAILGGNQFTANGINDAGTIVGSYQLGGERYGYSLSGGVYSLVGASGVLFTIPTDLNDSGQIVGNTYLPERGFQLAGGSYTQLLPPGYFFSRVNGINNLGQYVGSAQETNSSSSETREPMFFDGLSFIPFSLPGLESIELYDINDNGQILGRGILTGTEEYAQFLATPIVDSGTAPVPEPSTAVGGMTVLALLVVSIRHRARKV